MLMSLVSSELKTLDLLARIEGRQFLVLLGAAARLVECLALRGSVFRTESFFRFDFLFPNIR